MSPTNQFYCTKAIPILKKKSILFLASFLWFSAGLFAQTQQKQLIWFENKILSESFQSIESIYSVKFSYNPDLIKTGKKISLPEKEWALTEVLARLKTVF